MICDFAIIDFGVLLKDGGLGREDEVVFNVGGGGFSRGGSACALSY